MTRTKHRSQSNCLQSVGSKVPVIENPRTQLRLQWTVFGLTWLSWVFSITAVARCTFIKIGNESLDYNSLRDFGLFREPVYSDEHKILGCISYASNDDREGVFKASRAWGVFLVLTMSLSLLMVNLMILFLTDYNTRRFFLSVIRVLFLSAFVCNLFMFMIFAMQECGSDGIKCVPGGAGIVACLNAVVLLALCVLILITPAPKNPTFLPIWHIPKERHGDSVHGSDEEQPRSGSRREQFENADSSSRPSSERDLSPPPSPIKRTGPPESPIKRGKSPTSPKTIKSLSASPKKSNKAPPESPNKSNASPYSPKKAKGTKKVKSPPASPRKVSSSGSPDKVKESSTGLRKNKAKKHPDPSKSTGKAPEEKVVEVERIPNGRKVTTTLTHPDGSKTITYRIEDVDADDDTVKG